MDNFHWNFVWWLANCTKNLWRCSGSESLINRTHSNFIFLVRKACRANHSDMVSIVRAEMYHTWAANSVIVMVDGTTRYNTGNNPGRSLTFTSISGGPRWRHQMETLSALLVLCVGNSPVTGEFPSQRPVTRSFDIFFDLRLNKRLSKQPWGWWFETLSCPFWRHFNAARFELIHVIGNRGPRFCHLVTSACPYVKFEWHFITFCLDHTCRSGSRGFKDYADWDVVISIQSRYSERCHLRDFIFNINTRERILLIVEQIPVFGLCEICLTFLYW